MPSYVVLREAKNQYPQYTHRKNLSKILLDTGYVRVHRNILMASRKSEKSDSNVKIPPQYFLLKTIRELKKALIDEETGTFELGSLILIAFSLPSDSKRRRAISRLFRRAPCFRLASSVYAFPQIRYNKYEKSVLTRPDTILKKMIIFGVPVTYIPKVMLSSSSSTKTLIEELKEELTRRALKLVVDSEKLEFDSKYNKRISELKLEIRILRQLIFFFEKELKLNLKSVNNSLRKAMKVFKNL